MSDSERTRARMVETQIARRGVSDPRVLAAMRSVPRERFVGADARRLAYEDTPLAIGEGQTISQPYIVAFMLEVAQVRPSDRFFEIGTGSGYAAAVASLLAAEVFTMERHEALARAARERLASLGYRNVEVQVGDGTTGWLDKAPFDAIVVTAGGPSVPRALKAQLAFGGRLVIPVGDAPRYQRLLRITRTGVDQFEESVLCDVAFVPLIGEQGWKDG